MMEKMEAVPPLLKKCPKCLELFDAKKFLVRLECPQCKHVFPRPYAEELKLEEILHSEEKTWQQVIEFITNVLDFSSDPEERNTWLSVSLRAIMLQFSALKIFSRVNDGCRQKLEKTGKIFQEFLELVPAWVEAMPINLEKRG